MIQTTGRRAIINQILLKFELWKNATWTLRVSIWRGAEEVLGGKQVLEVIKLIGAFWLGSEAGARVPK